MSRDSASPSPVSTNPFRSRPFALFWVSRVLTVSGTSAQGVALGWQVYVLARQTHTVETSAFLVGMIGLAQLVPVILLMLFAGVAADRYDRRRILLISYGLQAVCAGLLVGLSMLVHPPLVALFALASLFGAAQAFMVPANMALVHMLVPSAALPRSVAWNSIGVMSGMIVGPWLAGLLCALSMPLTYGVVGGLYLSGVVALLFLHVVQKVPPTEGRGPALMLEGLRYVRSNPFVFAVLSLEFCALLLGDASALLPVFAQDLLNVGPEGFGLLRSATAIGTGLATLVFSIVPIRRHAGLWMLGGSLLYGTAISVFALSQTFGLSLIMLGIAGVGSSVANFIRQSIVQIVTPSHLQGRVGSVAGLCKRSSDELSKFESGAIVLWLGPVGAALFGGLGAIAVTLIWAKVFPELRKADRLLAAPVPHASAPPLPHQISADDPSSLVAKSSSSP